MVESLRDLLLKSGIVQQVREESRATKPARAEARQGRPATPASGRGGKPHGKSAHTKPASRPAAEGEIDLAKAYALRAQTEANERRRAEQAAAEQARLKRERRAKLTGLLKDRALNLAEAEHVRHFEYGGRIRRVHVDAAQLKALNAGELGVVQHEGRYLLVPRALAEQVRDIEPRQLALLVEPGSGNDADDIPDDLIW